MSALKDSEEMKKLMVDFQENKLLFDFIYNKFNTEKKPAKKNSIITEEPIKIKDFL